jgi:hypothetical protein
MLAWVFLAWIDKQRFFQGNIIFVQLGAVGRVCQWKQILFLSLVTGAAAQVKIIPVVGQPVITGAINSSAFLLRIGTLGPKVFDVAIVADEAFAKTTFFMLCLDQGLFDAAVTIDIAGEIEFLFAGLVILWVLTIFLDMGIDFDFPFFG